ncbi:glycosyltransferase family 4 protein [Arthrobacter sp. fls2-241-R2A-200]|uniref:glycosyltransferase family 4 protein n=1 Tax=Arthrobacter sp. fls2-241-R2A-200 TaxID=3040281 RepID=UPI00254B4306|nr:glycosyltransferase family 4 protein [Arthrobacter sp. fls2-241-R2A-200]
MKILHLGFEDPRMPGAGGGSVRTYEINRRLAADGFQVTVLTTRYPGWQERVQDGVHYVPVGVGNGRNRLTRLAGYVFRLPFEVRRRRSDADLVVEDFFAPFSTMAAPLWTQRPTIGVVQWLHARDKARQYRLPLHWVERWGVRTHSRLIAVSQGVADKLIAMNPTVVVDVIGNGVDPAAWNPEPHLGQDILCIGRIEFTGKGLDLLIAAWARSESRVQGKLLIAGTGPDEAKLRAAIADADLTDRVELLGWLSGEAKFKALSAARLVVLPSRQETFGLVAIEALATGTPVIAFDIPCLREIVPVGAGQLVPAFDVDALGAAMVDQYGNTGSGVIATARQFTARFNWDHLARRQGAAYWSALSVESEVNDRLGQPPGR